MLFSLDGWSHVNVSSSSSLLLYTLMLWPQETTQHMVKNIKKEHNDNSG